MPPKLLNTSFTHPRGTYLFLLSHSTSGNPPTRDTMGIFTTQGPVQLVPVHPPVAVFTPFIAQSPTTLVLREKMWSWTGDDFSVKDAATGQPVVRCEGKAFSMRERKRESSTSPHFK